MRQDCRHEEEETITRSAYYIAGYGAYTDAMVLFMLCFSICVYLETLQDIYQLSETDPSGFTKDISVETGTELASGVAFSHDVRTSGALLRLLAEHVGEKMCIFLTMTLMWMLL